MICVYNQNCHMAGHLVHGHFDTGSNELSERARNCKSGDHMRIRADRRELARFRALAAQHPNADGRYYREVAATLERYLS